MRTSSFFIASFVIVFCSHAGAVESLNSIKEKIFAACKKQAAQSSVSTGIKAETQFRFCKCLADRHLAAASDLKDEKKAKKQLKWMEGFYSASESQKQRMQSKDPEYADVEDRIDEICLSDVQVGEFDVMGGREPRNEDCEEADGGI